MEIFLLLVIVILLLVFQSVRNVKLKNMETKLSNIEDYLRKVQLYQAQKAEEQKQTVTETPKPVEDKVAPPQVIAPVIPPVVNDKPPVIVPETIVPPVVIMDEVIIDQVQEIRTELSVNEVMNTPVAPRQTTTQPLLPQKSFYDRFRENNPDLEKFIGENILSKVAITILVIGIAFFVKYAIDKEWINETARVGIGILCGGIVLGFAHRLRKNFKAFSSVLVSGSIAIFYFTIGIAFHEYQLFGQTTAFILMLVITSFSVFISIMYDRQELAVLSLIGGFATPFMVSTGQGNYQVLFIYVLILDLGMLVLAYLRKWNLLNILSYGFTMILYFGWLQSKVIGEENAPYKGALIFAAIFYVVFIVMSLIHNIKEKRKFGAVDITILVSNTFLFYGAGMQILNYYHPHVLGHPRNLQGFFSMFLALFNLVCSWLLYKKFKADKKLVYLMIGLTLTFATLVAPVQLHGNYITIFWALEGVLLLWLAQKSNIVMYRFASVLITVLMSFSLFMDWSQVYMIYHDLRPAVIINKGFITGIVCALSMLASAIVLRKETETVSWAGMHFNPTTYASFLQLAFIVLLYFSGLFELLFQLKQVVYYGVSITIVAGAYHFLFFTLLNMVQAKTENQKTGMLVFIFNYVNAVLFVLIFAVLPYLDFKDNMMQPERSYLGFIAHYVSLLCFVATLIFMRRWLMKDNDVKPRALNTVFVSVTIVYVASLELILHVSQAVIGTVKTIADEELWAKADELGIAETHIVKIGFPILWGLLAFVFLFIGMKKQNKSLRIMSLILIGIILLKLAFYDIRDASEIGKILAFIILGVVLLIIAFMYQKIKKLIIDDKPETDRVTDITVPPANDQNDPGIV
jgi:uncharacterized membrane protein